jgi:hypothetical protein
VRAVVVHAIDEQAAAFYRRFGFRALAPTPRTLMVTLSELPAAGYGRAQTQHRNRAQPTATDRAAPPLLEAADPNARE